LNYTRLMQFFPPLSQRKVGFIIHSAPWQVKIHSPRNQST